MLARAAKRAERVADLFLVLDATGSAEKLLSVRWMGDDNCSASETRANYLGLDASLMSSM